MCIRLPWAGIATDPIPLLRSWKRTSTKFAWRKTWNPKKSSLRLASVIRGLDGFRCSALKEVCLVDVGFILSKDRDTDFLLSLRFLAKLCGCASIGLMMMMVR